MNYKVPCRVDGSDLISDESNCFDDPDDEDVWEPGQEEPVGMGIELTEEDGFVMDMEDHGYDWDEDNIHIEEEDICRNRKRIAKDRLVMVQPRQRLNPPAEVILDMGAGTAIGQNESTSA